MTNQEYYLKNNKTLADALKAYDPAKDGNIIDWLQKEYAEFKPGDLVIRGTRLADCTLHRIEVVDHDRNRYLTSAFSKNQNSWIPSSLDMDRTYCDPLTLVGHEDLDNTTDVSVDESEDFEDEESDEFQLEDEPEVSAAKSAYHTAMQAYHNAMNLYHQLI